MQKFEFTKVCNPDVWCDPENEVHINIEKMLSDEYLIDYLIRIGHIAQASCGCYINQFSDKCHVCGTKNPDFLPRYK